MVYDNFIGKYTDISLTAKPYFEKLQLFSIVLYFNMLTKLFCDLITKKRATIIMLNRLICITFVQFVLKTYIMMYRRYIMLICCFSTLFLFSNILLSQETWTLKQCIEYAHENSIQIKQANISLEESKIDEKQNYASLFPTVSASAGLGVSHSKATATSANNTYGLSAGVTLFNGLRQYNSLQEQKLNVSLSELSLASIQKDIDLSIVQSYIQLLYMQEALVISQQNLEASEAQMSRSKDLLQAGSISESDYAQVVSQNSSDKYQVISAQNSLNEMKLKLKQLLELEINDEINVESYTIEESEILVPILDKESIYNKSLQVMPEIAMTKINQQVSELNYKSSKGNYYPTISANASIGTGVLLNESTCFSAQFVDGFSESFSLNISIPIFSGLQTKSSVQKAKINIQNTQLQGISEKKSLLSTIESLYNDVTSTQSQYIASKESLTASELSYNLVEEQFNLGLKNAVDLLVEKNNFLSAQLSLIQAKYSAALAIKLLNYYQGLPIE